MAAALSPAQLQALETQQAQAQAHLILEDAYPEPVASVAGFDVAYDEAGMAYAALAVLSAEDLVTRQVHLASAPALIDYIPGLLGYREIPLLVQAYQQLAEPPDVLLVDGGGTIHPRRMGSACMAGLELGLATVGVTKSLLLGEVTGEVHRCGEHAPVVDHGELVGYATILALGATKPIYVSPGHRISHGSALELVQRCATGQHKLPEPLRVAHKAATAARDAGRDA
ncbi:MAG: endonuclease V [Candidatus Thermoplasmatota archaeon]|nr:endonuclease V [Candidatus Thermoplasmatota archaeon]